MSHDVVTPIGSRDEFIEASFRAVQTPHLLTPREYRILESTHPHVAIQARKKAAQWQQMADEEQRRAAARPAATVPLVAPPPAPDEDVKAWWQRHRGAAASVGLVDSLFSCIGDFAKALREKNAARDERLAAVEARLTALEAKPSIKDAGVWTSGSIYNVGDIVSHAGSGWICHTAHVAAGGISHESFRLLVKRGADGRDAKDAR